MARPAATALLLAACLLFQVATCSRPSPEEPRRIPAAAVPGEDEQHNKLGARTTGTGGAAIAVVEGKKARADDGAATFSSATGSFVLRGKDGNDGSMSGGNRSAAALLRSKLARRFLAATSGGVVEGADSAAGASCHSNDTHNKSCPPASNKG